MKLKLAFCLFRYFPFGGLQRDFLRIARICRDRGHEVDVYTLSWEGPEEPGLNIHIISVTAWQNHSRTNHFAKKLQPILKQKQYDCVIGFNKMPGLDVYYAADVCYQSRIKEQRPSWYRLMPRYRSYLKAERSVFQADNSIEILVLSDIQKQEYHRCYSMPLGRFHLLPPGIGEDRLAPNNSEVIRAEMRNAYKIAADEQVLLTVGSGFKTKGLDRTLKALSALPESIKAKTRLWIVGQDNTEPFLKQAKELRIEHLCQFFGGRNDVNRFFLAADILVHPAYHENTGTVLLESLASGLPVLTVDVCGYAPYVEAAKAGKVLSSPFTQHNFDLLLEEVILANKTEWSKNALNFAKTADIYSLPEKAANLIETIAQTPKFAFNDYMQLKGDCFRDLDGRKTQRVLINNQSYFIK
ncbi:MAG TPA: glycosyltransferase, partial [Gammaproteobacteria bacterium]|nr:glycosyltransferase [Gammaproteobacteria bacterium]